MLVRSGTVEQLCRQGKDRVNQGYRRSRGRRVHECQNTWEGLSTAGVEAHPRDINQESSSSCANRWTDEEGTKPVETIEDAATSATTWMYKLFDEGEILLDGCGSAIDTLWEGLESTAVKNESERETAPGPAIIDVQTVSQEKMVAQESQPQGYGELLQTAARDSKDLVSLEELMPRPGSSSGHSYHQHQQHQHQRQQHNYYNLTPEQESPYSTLFFEEVTGATGIYPTPSRSAAESIGVGAPAPSAGLVVPSKAPPSTASSTSSNHSAPEHYQRQMEVVSAMIPEQTRGGSSSAHFGHQQHNHHHHHHHHHHHSRSSSVSHEGQLSSRERNDESQHCTKKRKVLSQDSNELIDDQGEDAKSIQLNDYSKKQNHSEIEKRRRDKMNTYITELSAMVPMCHAMSRKLDKLTVLRMAVQHLKTILGAVTSYTEGHYKPTFLSDQELKTLILQATEGFVFVVGCDRGRILYVSKSVSQTLNYSQGDLLGQSWFDILHPKDVAKVKEQLSSSDLSPRERLIDAKTMLPVKTDVPQGVSRLCPGARRSFFCRMKRKVNGRCSESQIKEEADTTTGCHRRKKQQNHDWKYCVIQCTGYLKSWAPAKICPEEQETEVDDEACNLSCLVAVGRMQVPFVAPSSTSRRLKLRTIEFVSRHAMDGKFLFVDQRATSILGFLPQELLGTSMYEYYHHDDIPHLAESHKIALQSTERVTTQVYRFRTHDAGFVKLCSEWKSFKNPWTKDIEYLVAKNSAVISDTRQVESSASRSEGSSIQDNYDYFTQSNGGLERLISSHVEVSKIGRQIAEEVLDHQRRSDQDSSSGNSPTSAPEPTVHNTEVNNSSQITTTASPEQVSEVHQVMGSDNSSSNPATTYNHLNNNVQLSLMANDQGASGEEDMMEMIGGTSIGESPNPVPSNGNDEAAMAVIMSLLEADAGLGGPVDFSGLPWPLP